MGGYTLVTALDVILRRVSSLHDDICCSILVPLLLTFGKSGASNKVQIVKNFGGREIREFLLVTHFVTVERWSEVYDTAVKSGELFWIFALSCHYCCCIIRIKVVKRYAWPGIDPPAKKSEQSTEERIEVQRKYGRWEWKRDFQAGWPIEFK